MVHQGLVLLSIPRAWLAPLVCTCAPSSSSQMVVVVVAVATQGCCSWPGVGCCKARRGCSDVPILGDDMGIRNEEEEEDNEAFSKALSARQKRLRVQHACAGTCILHIHMGTCRKHIKNVCCHMPNTHPVMHTQQPYHTPDMAMGRNTIKAGYPRIPCSMLPQPLS